MSKGRFLDYGGQYAPETMMAALEELETAYEHFSQDPDFQRELTDLLANYAGRPPLQYYAEKMAKDLGGAKIYLKREDLNHTGAHKINNALRHRLRHLYAPAGPGHGEGRGPGRLRQRLGVGRVQRGGERAGGPAAGAVSDGPLLPRLRGPASEPSKRHLRRPGRPAAAGYPRDGQLPDESLQIRHRHHRPVGQAPGRPHPGLRLLLYERNLRAAQGRKTLWELIGSTNSSSWTAPWAPFSSSGVCPPGASRSC